LISNEGRKVSEENISNNIDRKTSLMQTDLSPGKSGKSGHPKHKKKVLSKPIENINTMLDY
jgi:hypothetical protein